MTIKELMTGAAAVALITGAASAQTVSINSGSGFTGDAVIASEYQGALAGSLVLDFDFDDSDTSTDNIGAVDGVGAFSSLGFGGEVTITVTLNNAEFTSPITDAPDFTVDDCDFQISAGGGVGGDSVTYTNSSDNLFQCANGANTTNTNDENQGDTQASISLPIELTTIGDSADVTVTFARVSGSDGYTAPGATAEDLVDYSAAFEHSFTANPAAASDLLVTGTTLVDWSDTSVAGSEGFLGTLVTADVPPEVDVDLDGNAATYAAMLDGNQDVVFTFEDVTGFDSIVVDNGTGTCGAPDTGANTVTCTIPEDDIGDTPVDPEFTLVLDAATEVGTVPQLVDVELQYTLAADYVEEDVTADDFVTVAEDDGLGEADLTSVDFPWVRIGSDGTLNQIRVALANDGEASDITRVRVTCGASSNANLAGLEIDLSSSESAATGYVQEGQILKFNSIGLGAAAGETGNCDVTGIELQYDETSTVTGATEVNNATANRLFVGSGDISLSDL